MRMDQGGGSGAGQICTRLVTRRRDLGLAGLKTAKCGLESAGARGPIAMICPSAAWRKGDAGSKAKSDVRR